LLFRTLFVHPLNRYGRQLKRSGSSELVSPLSPAAVAAAAAAREVMSKLPPAPVAVAAAIATHLSPHPETMRFAGLPSWAQKDDADNEPSTGNSTLTISLYVFFIFSSEAKCPGLMALHILSIKHTP